MKSRELLTKAKPQPTRTKITNRQPLVEGVLDSNDDDGWMAKSQLYSLAKNAISLHKMISDSDELDPWVQSKITKAEDYINSIKTYLEYHAIGQPSHELVIPDQVTYNPDMGQESSEDVAGQELIVADESMHIDGMDGPYMTKSGRALYYDNDQGQYWDPEIESHIRYSEWVRMNRDPA